MSEREKSLLIWDNNNILAENSGQATSDDELKSLYLTRPPGLPALLEEAQKLGFTQEKIAGRLDIDPRTLRRNKQGRDIGPKKRTKWAEVLSEILHRPIKPTDF
jgi:hypothetical protein